MGVNVGVNKKQKLESLSSICFGNTELLMQSVA